MTIMALANLCCSRESIITSTAFAYRRKKCFAGLISAILAAALWVVAADVVAVVVVVVTAIATLTRFICVIAAAVVVIPFYHLTLW